VFFEKLRADKIQVEQVAAYIAEKTSIIQSLEEVDLSRANIAQLQPKPGNYSDEIIDIRSLPAPAREEGYRPPSEKKATRHRRRRRLTATANLARRRRGRTLPVVAGEEHCLRPPKLGRYASLQSSWKGICDQGRENHTGLQPVQVWIRIC
jgi:hypothetical protein